MTRYWRCVPLMLGLCLFGCSSSPDAPINQTFPIHPCALVGIAQHIDRNSEDVSVQIAYAAVFRILHQPFVDDLYQILDGIRVMSVFRKKTPQLGTVLLVLGVVGIQGITGVCHCKFPTPVVIDY